MSKMVYSIWSTVLKSVLHIHIYIFISIHYYVIKVLKSCLRKLIGLFSSLGNLIASSVSWACCISTAADTVKLSLFMPLPVRTNCVTSHLFSSHKDAVPQFRFVLKTVAVAVCPSGFKHYHIYHDIPPSSFGHLLVTIAQKLPHSSSLSFTLLYLSLFLLWVQKKNRARFLLLFYTRYSWISWSGIEDDVATMVVPSRGGRRHEIWL